MGANGDTKIGQHSAPACPYRSGVHSLRNCIKGAQPMYISVSAGKLVWRFSVFSEQFPYFPRKDNYMEEREKWFSTTLPRGHDLSKVSAATVPQIHTIRTVGDIYAVLVICLFALRFRLPPISLFFSIFKGDAPRKLPRPPCSLLPACFDQ